METFGISYQNLALYGEAAKTSLGFFWKSGWAFILGYSISAIIQSFVPKERLTRHMGEADVESIALSTIFGSISSSCSFAALATARALLQKGAHFVSAVAFMFASTNLVIELGILIVIFLGWSYLMAELIGGLLLIAISSLLIRTCYPEQWIEQARQKVETEGGDMEEDFDPWERIKSKEGWVMVTRKFVMEWKMVWEDILIGFTIAGFMAVLVPDSFWKALFLTELAQQSTGWMSVLIVLQNALVAPFVAAATFIGSMGNIPLATVLNSGGVLFAGIMGFIYSDLVVPPLVHVNAEYYGWKVALYIVGIMYISIVVTALLLQGGFSLLGLVPEQGGAVKDIAQFKVDYTLWFNLVFAILAAGMVYGSWTHPSDEAMQHGGGKMKRFSAYCFLTLLLGGLIVFALTGGTS